MKRSKAYKEYFDNETRFMRGKLTDGSWRTPFDPVRAEHRVNDYCEGNAWQYLWLVPQDPEGLIELLGGDEKYTEKLDELFSMSSDLGEGAHETSMDITGLVGQYAHGNEPSHHMAYLYNYVGKPEKTTEKVHYILDNFYKNAPDGLIGNEDCGQMSAWYVLSSIGLYQVTPGETILNLVEPIHKNVKIQNRLFKYNKSSKINEKYCFTDFTMLDSGFNSTLKYSKYIFYTLHTLPVIESDTNSFKEKLNIKMKTAYQNDKIFYSFEKNGNFKEYKEPIEVKESTKIYSYTYYYYSNSCGPNSWYVSSDTISAQFYKKPNNYTIEIKSKYNSQYTAGGDEGIIDGINGTENWRKGEWQGYQSQDFEAIIDLQTEKNISNFSATFLQDSRSWILFPTKVDYFVSNDNVNFTMVGKVTNSISPKYEVNKIQNFEYKLPQELKAKYVKVKAYNFGKLPDWHLCAGGDAFIFIDEITIK